MELELRTHPTFLETLISKYDFGPAKLTGLSRNRPQITIPKYKEIPGQFYSLLQWAKHINKTYKYFNLLLIVSAADKKITTTKKYTFFTLRFHVYSVKILACGLIGRLLLQANYN